MKKNRFNDIVKVEFEKYCSNRAEACDFTNKIRDENPNIVFFRRECIPDPTTEESVLVTITGWYDYSNPNSKPKGCEEPFLIRGTKNETKSK